MFCLTVSLSVFLLLLPSNVLIEGNQIEDWALNVLCHNDDRAMSLVLISQKFPVTFCSGTIISPSYILTAAHCSSLKPLYVYPGLAFKNLDMLKEDEANGSRVVDQHLHPDYNRKTFENDIAVFEISPKFTLDSAYGGDFRAWLPNSVIGANPEEWDNCTVDSYVMGWSPSIENMTSDFALCVRAPVMSNEDCQSSYPAVALKNSICVRQTNRVCLRSGGAVLCNGEQVGVVSYVHCNLVHSEKDLYTPVKSMDDGQSRHDRVSSIWWSLVALGLSGIRIADHYWAHGRDATLDWLIEVIHYYDRWCAWYRFWNCIKASIFRVAVRILSRGENKNRPYVSVRTDTAVDFIHNSINARSAVESSHRFIIPLVIILCAFVVMKQIQ